jgi:hypothetical protein
MNGLKLHIIAMFTDACDEYPANVEVFKSFDDACEYMDTRFGMDCTETHNIYGAIEFLNKFDGINLKYVYSEVKRTCPNCMHCIDGFTDYDDEECMFCTLNINKTEFDPYKEFNSYPETSCDKFKYHALETYAEWRINNIMD